MPRTTLLRLFTHAVLTNHNHDQEPIHVLLAITQDSGSRTTHHCRGVYPGRVGPLRRREAEPEPATGLYRHGPTWAPPELVVGCDCDAIGTGGIRDGHGERGDLCDWWCRRRE